MRMSDWSADVCSSDLSGMTTASEEAQRLGRIADQQVLRLLIMVQHHLVRLAPDARLLVSAKGRMGRIGVVAIGPDAPGLDGAAHAIGGVAVAAPHPRAQAIERVVCDVQRLRLDLEGDR